MIRTVESLVDALSTDAVPTLRVWVDDHRATVESVVAGAVDATQENVALAEEVDFTLPTPLAFGTVSDLQDDGLTNEQRKRALAWLNKRADRTEGEFDAEEAQIALALIPGWRSDVVTTLRAVPMNATTADGSFPAALVEAGFVHVPVPGNRTPSVGSSRASNIDGVAYATKYGDKDEALRVTPEIAATFRTFDAKKTKVKDLPAGRWAADIRWSDDGSAVLTKPVLVFAEPGGLRVTNVRGETVTVSGKAAWRVLYGERQWVTGKGNVNKGGLGLQEAAKTVVDALSRKVATQEAFAKSQQGWGGALCPVCFQRAAVTPTSRHMVDHRHQRPGWGYNVSPCDGNRFPPYMESPEGSKYALGNLRKSFDTHVATLRDTLTHPEKKAYTVKVYVKDTRGSPVYDYVTVKDRFGRDTTKHVRREKQITVRQGHPLFRDLYAKDVKAQRAQILAVADAIPFYAAAVRVWKPGLDDMAPIYAGMRREADTPALPADLFSTKE